MQAHGKLSPTSGRSSGGPETKVTDLRPSNLRYLHQHYLEAREGLKAAARIDGAVTPKAASALGWLLRHHNEADIEDKETWERDEVDNLLEYYSLLEVASLLQ